MALKRKSMFGLEVELFTMDTEGRLANGADEIFKAAEGKKMAKYLKPEFSKSMVELCAKENRSVSDCIGSFMENLEDLVELAEKIGYRLLPLGCHPGRTIPKVRSNTWYDAKKAVIGKDIVRAGRVCGFHFHYTLPEGIVEKQTERIKTVGRSRARDVFLQQYNFLLAADPALLTFCQCSPFWMGTHWGKDCRVLVYRDMMITKGANSLQGVHYYVREFGSLPHYELTLQDLRVMADEKKSGWLRLLEQNEFPTNEIASYPSLKFMWGPLRVNKIGTFEYRGPDMNHPDVIFSASSLLMFALRAIEQQELEVFPSDIGIEEPFVLEDNVIYIPPYATVKYLERRSVLEGFESEATRRYCSSLLRLVDRISGEGKSSNLKILKKMLTERKTVSDEILDMVKKNGYSLEEEVPEDMLNHAALHQATKFSSQLSANRKAFESFAP
jgi:hypothetical protein